MSDLARHILVTLALVGLWCSCGGDSAPMTTEPPLADTRPCMPPGLEAARAVETMQLPPGCAFSSPGTLNAPLEIHTAQELNAALSCEEGAAPPAVDFEEDRLLVASFSMSPAFAGSALVDDGTVVTLVQRQRPNCPDDPLPMPMESVLVFRLPLGAERTYRQLACSLPQRECP